MVASLWKFLESFRNLLRREFFFKDLEKFRSERRRIGQFGHPVNSIQTFLMVASLQNFEGFKEVFKKRSNHQVTPWTNGSNLSNAGSFLKVFSNVFCFRKSWKVLEKFVQRQFYTTCLNIIFVGIRLGWTFKTLNLLGWIPTVWISGKFR